VNDTWDDLVRELAPLGEKVLARAPQDITPQARMELYRSLANGFALGAVRLTYDDPDYPCFYPHLNEVFNFAAPVPDFVYQTASVRGEGIYRLSGYRGTTRFVDVNFRSGPFRYGVPGNPAARIDLDDLTRDASGYFSVILSQKRPAGHRGNWAAMPADTTRLMVRHAACDWLHEVDARLAIERLDVPAAQPRMPAAAIAARMAKLAEWAEDQVSYWLGHVATIRQRGVINRVERHDYSTLGGAAGQVYFEGLYELAPGEALIVETDVPDTCRYWSVMVTDEHFGTIDWINHQSSINDVQARRDADGKFRAVVSPEDPGIANWLDTAGRTRGALQFRWNNSSSVPDLHVRKVNLAALAGELPADTARTTPAQRDRILRERREGAQLRRRW